MWFSVSEHLTVTLWSVAMGVFLGCLYDCIKLTRILMGIAAYSGFTSKLKSVKLPFIKKSFKRNTPKHIGRAYVGIMMFIGDVFYSLIASFCYSVFLFHAIRGHLRWYFIVASAIGFMLYYFTVSKFVLALFELITFLLRVILTYVITIILLPFKLFTHSVKNISNVLYRKYMIPLFEEFKYKSAVKNTEKLRKRAIKEIHFD